MSLVLAESTDRITRATHSAFFDKNTFYGFHDKQTSEQTSVGSVS